MCFRKRDIARSHAQETPAILTEGELAELQPTFHIEIPRTPEEQEKFLKRLRSIGPPRRVRNQ